MRIKLLVAALDGDYAGHLSGTISINHADAFEVSVCSSSERLHELLASQRFDVALLDAGMVEGAELRYVHMPLLLWAEEDNAAETALDIKKVDKYRRVSAIVADILERYSKVSSGVNGSGSNRARVTAVWSPAGGVGKTTVALAFAAKMDAEGKQAMCLNLEHFSSMPVYFAHSGKSISVVFEMLEAHEGNLKMLVQGIACKDGGVAYFCKPENFDDMNILTPENLALLIEACAGLADELVIDMSCVCDESARRVFELADDVLVVADASAATQAKLSQFASQNNVFEHIRAKACLVKNKGAQIDVPIVDSAISLPLVQNANPSVVYKALSVCDFRGGGL